MAYQAHQEFPQPNDLNHSSAQPNSQTTTSMMALNYWLIRRAEDLLKTSHQNFEALLRFEDE
jgi:hypothetical protein